MALSPTAIDAHNPDATDARPGVGRPGISLRLRVRMAAPRLDARLAAGEPPGTPAEAIRADQLVSARERERLTVALERVCRESPIRHGYSAAVPVSADALALARPALEQLARALRCAPSHHPRGVALTRLLLTEPDSPLYRPTHPWALHEAVRTALLALASGANSELPLIGGR